MPSGESLFLGGTGFARDDAGDWLQHYMFLAHFPKTVLVGGVVEDPVLIETLERLAASPDISDQSWSPMPYRMAVFANTSVMHDEDGWSILQTFPSSYGRDVDEIIRAQNPNDRVLFEELEQFLPQPN